MDGRAEALGVPLRQPGAPPVPTAAPRAEVPWGAAGPDGRLPQAPGAEGGSAASSLTTASSSTSSQDKVERWLEEAARAQGLLQGLGAQGHAGQGPSGAAPAAAAAAAAAAVLAATPHTPSPRGTSPSPHGSPQPSPQPSPQQCHLPEGPPAPFTLGGGGGSPAAARPAPPPRGPRHAALRRAAQAAWARRLAPLALLDRAGRWLRDEPQAQHEPARAPPPPAAPAKGKGSEPAFGAPIGHLTLTLERMDVSLPHAQYFTVIHCGPHWVRLAAAGGWWGCWWWCVVCGGAGCSGAGGGVGVLGVLVLLVLVAARAPR